MTTIRETGLVERVCEHGVGHPMHDSAKKMAERYGHDIGTWLVHGCDGCCSEWDDAGTMTTEEAEDGG